MSTSPTWGGSSVSARSVTPALNLAELVNQLGKALSPNASTGQAAVPLLTVEKGRVTVQIRGVLHRLFKDGAFAKAFTPVDGAGLIRDTTIPPRGTIARIGGRLLAGTEGATAKALARLHDDIAALVDSALADVDPASLTLPSMDAALDRFAASLDGERKPKLPANANMVPIAFAGNDRRAEERAKDVGRVLTAIEMVDGRDWLELLLQGIAHKMRNDGLDEEIEGTLATIRSQRKQPGSQMRDFLDFLDDQALARVRLQVTMRLMSALAHQSKRPGFRAYVARVIECYERHGGIDGEALLLDPSKVYGGKNTSDLADHLRKSLFYNCLPAWAHGAAQLFETRTEPTQGFATVREVSYHFRVNGNNPETGKHAFDSRLAQRFEDVLSAPGPDAFVRRDIAEWVFLYLVIPDSLDSPTAVDIRAEGVRLAAALKDDPVGTLKELHTALAARSRVVDDIAGELIRLLKNRSHHVVSIAHGAVDTFVVSLHRDIVDWDAIDSITSKTDILRKSEVGDNSIEWFKYLTVSADALVKGSIASYSVKTQLKERSLAVAGPARSLAMSRDLSVRVLPVRLVPYKLSKEDRSYLADVPNTRYFDAGAGIEVQYALDMLTMRKQQDQKENEKREQFRAASYIAFTLLTYITLWDLQRRVRTAHPETAMSMVRLALTGKQDSAEEDANDPYTAVYAVSQALEKALAREGAIKLQGMTTSLGKKDKPKSLSWKRRGALHALLGGQRLKFELEGDLDKVALVTYVTRPCDEHPAHADADGYLFMSRTYVAERGEGGAMLRCLNMRSRLVESRKDFKDPKPILEEIARLKLDGFQHVMLLSHHFGNRHIGRAAERHAPHGTLEFLDAAVKGFPEMRLYPLRRDMFPATRLHQRAASESGFEVLSFKDHQKMYEATSAEALRSILPVYTFATLAVVGQDDERPQSGFCTYFYDVEQRISDIEVAKLTEQNILGLGGRDGIRRSLVSMLRGIHFMESEKPAEKTVQRPVLDPYGWVAPMKRATAGELPVMTRRGGRTVFLSLPAVLAHVTKVLHKEDAEWKQ
jgi:hypothetical protein